MLGSIVGGVLSYLTTRHLKRQEWQQAQREKEIAKREDLYSAFLNESSRILFGTLDKEVDKATEFAELYTLTGKMQLLSSAEVIEAARAPSFEAFESYSKPDQEQRTKEEEGNVYKLRTRFTRCAREEIERFRQSRREAF